VSARPSINHAQPPENFPQRKNNDGRNVRARIAHLADKSENDLKQGGRRLRIMSDKSRLINIQ
jgi:hypothetical protein